MKSRHLTTSFIGLLLLLIVAGCAKSSHSHDHDHDHAHDHDHEHHAHVHVAPHGGTLVVLAEETWNMEFVHDSATGTLDAYVLDAHAENFVRIAQPAFALRAQTGETEQVLTFQAVANSATGETVGETSQFRAQAEWLKSVTAFDATLSSITVRGSTFTDVTFAFPREDNAH